MSGFWLYFSIGILSSYDESQTYKPMVYGQKMVYVRCFFLFFFTFFYSFWQFVFFKKLHTHIKDTHIQVMWFLSWIYGNLNVKCVISMPLESMEINLSEWPKLSIYIYIYIYQIKTFAHPICLLSVWHHTSPFRSPSTLLHPKCKKTYGANIHCSITTDKSWTWPLFPYQNLSCPDSD